MAGPVATHTVALASVTYAPTRILDGIKSLSYASNMLATLRPTGSYNTADQDQVSVTWRVHRDIVP